MPLPQSKGTLTCATKFKIIHQFLESYSKINVITGIFQKFSFCVQINIKLNSFALLKFLINVKVPPNSVGNINEEIEAICGTKSSIFP